MKLNTLDLLSYFLVVIPFVIAIFTCKKTSKEYLPFFYFIFLIGLCDLISAFFFISSFKSKVFWATSRSINSLAEPIILIWLYRRWGLFDIKKNLYGFLLCLWIFVWLIEIFYLKSFYKNKIYMATVYSFVGVLLTVTMLNKMMSANQIYLNQNAKFFICVGFLVYLFGQTIPVLFSLYQLKTSLHFRMKMYYLIDVFVAAMYLLFAYALILIARQTKQGKNRNFRTVINGKKKDHDYHLRA